MMRTCKLVETDIWQGEKGYALAVTLTDEVTGMVTANNLVVAYFPERYRDVAAICARALEERWKQEPRP